jgi:hypothetical protein
MLPAIYIIAYIYCIARLFWCCYLATFLVAMPPKKRVSAPSTAPRKRARVAAPLGSASQPICVGIQQLSAPSALSLSPSPSPPSPKALRDALQATTFESQFYESRPEASIVAPTEGSKEATVASSTTTNKAAEDAFDAEYEGNYDGIDWLRLPRFRKPPTTLKRKPSWIY